MNSISSEMRRIILVEDQRGWAENFVEILRRTGETRLVDIYDPNDFLERMTSPSQFENFDICITDLELFSGDDENAGDLAGLTQILPRVRELAPWMPVACLSRFIQMGNPVLWKLSMSDLDFFSPKKMILDVPKKKGEGDTSKKETLRTYSEFNPDQWQQMLQEMQFKRIANITSRSLCEIRTASERNCRLSLDSGTTNMLSTLVMSEKSLGDAICLLGIEGSEFFVKTLQPGFSGVNVSLVNAHGHTSDEPVRASWLLKWGKPIWKLEEEACAHRRVFCRGIERSLQIPQLHPHVIVQNGIGYIAYAFEKDARVALDVAKENIELLSESLCTITHGLYDEARCKTILGASVLEKWVGLPVDEVTGLLAEDETFEISWALLHGDLHLRNVFIRGNSPTLIDFARSDFGPVAIDAAKIIVDMLVWAPPANLPKSLTEEAIAQSGLAPILSAFRPYLKNKNDVEFLNVAMRAIANKYKSYSDVGNESKNRIANITGVAFGQE